MPRPVNSDWNNPTGTVNTIKMVELGTCTVCGKPVIVAAWVAKIKQDITECSRECAEAKAERRVAV